MTERNYSLDEMSEIANLVLDIADEDNVIVFEGEMGSGKTTLIKAICIELGVEDATSSPTYALINEYQIDDDTIYHMDLFRLKDVDEAIDIGIEDYLHSDALCLVEWPEVVQEVLPINYTRVSIEMIDPSLRKIQISKTSF